MGESNDDIVVEVVNFFSNMFMAEGILENFDLLKVIPAILTEEDNSVLEASSSMVELFQTIKNLDGKSAA